MTTIRGGPWKDGDRARIYVRHAGGRDELIGRIHPMPPDAHHPWWFVQDGDPMIAGMPVRDDEIYRPFGEE